MKLVGIELVRTAVPFRSEIGTAAGVHRQRPLLFIRVVAEESEGWGECAALADGTAVDPAIGEVEAATRGRGVARILESSAARDGQLPAQTDVAQLFGSSPTDRMVAAAFEMAVADAELRLEGRSMAALLELGPGFGSVPVGAAVGIPADRDVGVVRAAVSQAIDSGVTRVRLKIEPGWAVDPVRAVRDTFSDVVLQVDANGSFRATDDAQLAELAALEAFGVLCIEQPLPPADLVAHAELARRLAVPICLDESLSSPRRVLDAIRNQSCQVACLKPARLGGVRATRMAHAACVEAGISVFVGGFFEAGLGRAANLALAARLSQDAPGLVGDLGDPAGYLALDPCGYPAVVNGWVDVPLGPGVGAWPIEAALGELEVRRSWFPATYT